MYRSVSPQTDIPTLIVGVCRLSGYMVFRNEKFIKAIFRLHKWRHALKKLKILSRNFNFCKTLCLIC